MLRSTIGGILAGAMIMMLAQPTPVIGQTTGADVSKQTGEAWETVKAYGADKKKDAVAYGKKLMKETDTKIGQLEKKAAKTSGEAKALYQKEIKELKGMRVRVAKKLNEMKKASGAAWDSAKHGFADAYKDLHQAYEKAAKQFK